HIVDPQPRYSMLQLISIRLIHCCTKNLEPARCTRFPQRLRDRQEVLDILVPFKCGECRDEQRTACGPRCYPFIVHVDAKRNLPCQAGSATGPEPGRKGRLHYGRVRESTDDRLQGAQSCEVKIALSVIRWIEHTMNPHEMLGSGVSGGQHAFQKRRGIGYHE